MLTSAIRGSFSKGVPEPARPFLPPKYVDANMPEGARTLFTCRSGIMAGFVASQPGMDEVDVIPFRRISSAETAGYDAIVVDEAQDVLNFDDLATLDRILQGGLEDGRWFFLLDSNNQRGLIGLFDQEAMDYLWSFRPADLILNDNCRNTREIVSRTRAMTGADVGVSAAGTGPDVEVVFEATPELRAAAVDRQLEALIGAGVEPAEIVLLSPLPLHDSIYGRLPARWRQRIDILDLRGLQSAAPFALWLRHDRGFQGSREPLRPAR